MSFINYFTCRTQRVQLRADTETVGKKNFGDLLSKQGASIIINKKKNNKRKQNDDVLRQEVLDNADNPDAFMDSDDDQSSVDLSRQQLNSDYNPDYVAYLNSEYRDEMLFMLETGLNLVIYGVGSKINFMKRFTQSLKGSPMVIVNGFHPGATLKCALKQLTNFINHTYVKSGKSSLKEMTKFFSMHDNIEYLLKTLSIESLNIPKIYIIIISLDGGNLKSLELQRHLSVLAK